MNLKQLKLLPSDFDILDFKAEILRFAKAIGVDDIHLGDVNLLKENFQAYIQNLIDQSLGRNLPTGWVPHSRYWLISETGKVIGSSDLRHFLTTALEDFGGHIGYIIHPDYRNKGYATNLLSLMLLKAKSLSIDTILITVDINNKGSRRVIEKNGGKLEYEYFSETAKKKKAKYTIRI